MNGLFVKKVHVLNKGILHLVNDIFGILDSKRSRTESRYYFDYCYYCDYFAF